MRAVNEAFQLARECRDGESCKRFGCEQTIRRTVMIKHVIVLSALALLAATPVWAINKCTGADGKVAFQDAPCAGKGEKIEVRPASGAAPKAAASAAGATATTGVAAPPAKKKEGAFGESWRRRTYLENQGVPGARGALQSNKRDCERKLADLEARKSTANNNLAGATYLQSLSAQMQAEATMCDMRSRDLSTKLQALEKELGELVSQ